VWYANIEPLSRHFRVYAPDVIDQMGRSAPTCKLRTPRDCSDWLAEVLDALHIERATLIGHSHGGWQALNMALTNPQRVARMVLLSPASAFVRLSLQLFLHMLPVLVLPTRRMFYWSFQWLTTMPLRKEHPLVEQLWLPTRCRAVLGHRFTDDELRQIGADAAVDRRA
jgi:pimeloyl-ACP methyl ester carboxylesterase